jgi:hypothetical protein
MNKRILKTLHKQPRYHPVSEREQPIKNIDFVLLHELKVLNNYYIILSMFRSNIFHFSQTICNKYGTSDVCESFPKHTPTNGNDNKIAKARYNISSLVHLS